MQDKEKLKTILNIYIINFKHSGNYIILKLRNKIDSAIASLSECLYIFKKPMNHRPVFLGIFT